jgi:hypothetical protein
VLTDEEDLMKRMRTWVIGAILVGSALLLPRYMEASKDSFPPGVMFSSLLDNVKLHESGTFSLGNQMQGVFIGKGAKGTVKLGKADGTGIYEWTWEEEPIKAPYSRFDFNSKIKDLATGEIVYSQVELKQSGDYVLDFYTGETRFYTFPFSVWAKKPDDPFLGGELYFLEGDWSKWGYMYMYNADPEQNLTWKIWLRHTQHDEATKYHDIKIEVTRDKDGKVMCVSRDNTSHNLPRTWTRVGFDMVNPPVKTSGGEYFKAKDLLATDGGYTLEMTVNGEHYGTWALEVKDGKFVTKGRSLRGEADPLTFVEGGRDAWWYEKVEGKADKKKPEDKKKKKKSK